MSREVRPADETRGERLRALRVAAGFRRQEDLANASSGRLRRTDVVRVEGGGDRFQSPDRQEAYAQTFGVTRAMLFDYIDGNLTVEAVVAARRPVERLATSPATAGGGAALSLGERAAPAPSHSIERDGVIADIIVADLIRGGHMEPEMIASVRPRVILKVGFASDGSVPSSEEQRRIGLEALTEARDSALVAPLKGAVGAPSPDDPPLRRQKPQHVEAPKKKRKN